VTGRDVASLAASWAGPVAADAIDTEARGAGVGGGTGGAERLRRDVAGRIDAGVGDGAPARPTALVRATGAASAAASARHPSTTAAASAVTGEGAGSPGTAVAGDRPAAARGRGSRGVLVAAVGGMPAAPIPAAGEPLRADAARGTTERPVANLGRVAAGRGQQHGGDQDAARLPEMRAHGAASAGRSPSPRCQAHR
jgi:hypothetical protein